MQAYVDTEELRALLAFAETNPQRHPVRTRLDNFYRHANDAREAHRPATTIET